MRKFLLTLAAAFVATLAMAQEYPTVASVEELNALPDSTIVLFENIQTVKVEQDMGYYVRTINCLSDGTTQIAGNVYPVPECFTAVGFAHTVEDYDGTTYREFLVDEVKSVSSFTSLGDLLNYSSIASNYNSMVNSPLVKANSGEAYVTHVYNDYVFYYTIINTGYYNQTMYSAFKIKGASTDYQYDCFAGAILTAENGWFGTFTPSKQEYNEDYEPISYTGGHFALSQGCTFWSIVWSPEPISYQSCSWGDPASGYVGEGQAIRLPAGGTFVERDGKYFYEGSYEEEEYVEGQGWVNVAKTASIECASNLIDFSEYVGKVCEDFVAGVWDKCVTSNVERLLVNEFIGKVAYYENISDFLSKGEQYEEEILTRFNNPLTVTYKLDDGNYKFMIIVTDETGSLALDYSDGIEFDNEGNPSANYAALQAIQVGDNLTEVAGFAQFYVSSSAPRITCATYDYTANTAIVYVPTVASSGAAVKAAMTVTVGDMLAEWEDCSANNNMPKIANSVVRVLDAQVVDTVDGSGSDVKYLIQGTDTMELSNLWDKFEFTTFERNNIVGIADYCTVNSNYIYQLMPLSQAHITDASLTPEVSTYDELVANEGTPVIVKNATVTSVAGAWSTDYFMFDEVFVTNFPVAGTFDLYGLYENGTFAVYNVVNAYGFAAISDLDTYVKQFPEAEGQAYNITEPVVVTHVAGDNVFVQYAGTSRYGQPLQCGNVLTGVKTAVKQGDLISGIKGISTPCSYYEENWNPIVTKGASFAVADDAEITVISSDNTIDYGASTEYAQLGFSMPERQGSAVKLLPVGTILEDGGRYYYQETGFTYDENDNQITVYYTVEFISSVVDLSEWVGADFGTNSIVGVLDYMNTSDDVKFYVHGLMSNNIECQNIGEVLATGPLSDYTMTLSIANPVIVTYVYTTEWSAGLMVQDETGAIFVSYNNAATVEGIKVGDAVTGILGAASWGGGQAPSLAAYNDNSGEDYPVTVVSSGNEVEPAIATIAELSAEADIYANWELSTTWVNRLVKLQGVTFGMGVDSSGEEWPVLIQGEDQLLVTNDFAEKFNVTEGQEFDLVGVVDCYKMNYNNIYTVQPRSNADFYTTGIEGVNADNNRIYLDAQYQVVAPGAVAVALYDVNGRQVGTTDAAGLAEGIYVVRATYADGTVAAAKVVR